MYKILAKVLANRLVESVYKILAKELGGSFRFAKENGIWGEVV